MDDSITAIRRRGASFTISPGAVRAAEHEQKEMLENSAKIQAFFKYFKFEDSQNMDRCLGRVSLHSSLVTGRERNKHMKRNRDLRLAKVEVLRREIAGLTDAEAMERLEETFTHYCDKILCHSAGVNEMAVIGWMRLLRDCRLLDHRVTLVVADMLFTQEGGADASSMQGDLHLDYNGFLTCLRRLIAVKLPSRAKTPKAVEETLLVLARKWLLPFQRPSLQLRGVDGLFSRECLNLMRTHDAQVKRLFAWYSSLGETDPKRVTWEGVRHRPATLGSAEFALMLLNFEVLPDLLSKHEAVDVFMECEEENDADEQTEAMLLPAFMETLAMVALRVGDHMNRRIRDAVSPDEMRALKCYVDRCPTTLRQQLLVAYRSVMRDRGRADVGMKTLIAAVRAEPSDLYDLAGEANREHEALLGRQRLWQAQIAVVIRREELRQRFAEARLRNFYRDVRTPMNNSTWPPHGLLETGQQGDSPRWEAPEHNNASASTDAAQQQQVAFYSDQRQIKTPQPRWLPSTNHHLSSRSDPRGPAPYPPTHGNSSPRDQPQAPNDNTRGASHPGHSSSSSHLPLHASSPHDSSGLTAAALLDMHQKALQPHHSGGHDYGSHSRLDSGHASCSGGGAAGGGGVGSAGPGGQQQQQQQQRGNMLGQRGNVDGLRSASFDGQRCGGGGGGGGGGFFKQLKRSGGGGRSIAGEDSSERDAGRDVGPSRGKGGGGGTSGGGGGFGEARGTSGAGNWAMLSSKSYQQMKVMIEEVDESESIVAFSKRLPSLRLQQRNGRDSDADRAYAAAFVRGGSSSSPPPSVQEMRGLLTARATTAPVAGVRPTAE
ncbi:MAG: hypothetical protein WDW36_006629 [Sanguina aurantia]